MNEPVFIFGIALALDAALSWIIPRSRRAARLGLASFFFFIYSFEIVAHLGSPLHPIIAATDLPHRLLLQIVFCVWWGAAARETVLLLTLPAELNRAMRENEILFDIIASGIYICAGVAVLTVVFRLPVQGLIATSGILAIVLGLALQNSLGDVFSGLALSVEKPFEIGDQIRLDNGVEGKVIQINWRATHLLNGSNDLVVIPHNVMAKMQIQNHTALNARYSTSLDVSVDFSNDSDFVKKILKHAAMTCSAIVEDPSPSVTAVEMSGKRVRYKISFNTASFAEADSARSQLIAQIQRRAQSVQPSSGLIHFFGEEGLVDNIEFFQALSTEEKMDLSAKVARHHFQADEKLVEQGSSMNSVQYVLTGVIEISRKFEDKGEVKISRLGPGDSFGALALLTGAPPQSSLTALTSGTLLGLCSNDLKPLITSRPDLAQAMSQIAAKQQKSLDHVVEQTDSLEPIDILSRIRSFFQMDK